LNVIRNNTIKNNSEYGINLMFSDEILVYHNNIIDNNPNAKGGLLDSYDNGYPSGGNYWSDYNGTDANGDGIGDTPYEIMIPGGSVNDSYPFIENNGWLKSIDVDQDTFGRGFPIRHAVDGDWAGAQSFHTTNDSLTRVDLYLRKFGTPEFNLTVELRENHPQGNLIDTLTFTPEEVPSSWEWFNLDFDDTALEPDTNLFIVIPPAPSGVTTSFGYEWGYAFGNQYDDGSFWFTRDGGNLWRDLPVMYEFAFRTYGYD
jgi:parallel beta-helix repeat protein